MVEKTEKIAKSLITDSTELMPHFPYLLQDIWEFNANCADIIELIFKHIPKVKRVNILDLACGKGDISIKIAKELSGKIKGVDREAAFIEYAIAKANEYGVNEFVNLEAKDLLKAVEEEKNYDLVIAGNIGEVFGKPIDTLKQITKTIKPNGYLIYSDAFSYDSVYCPTKKEWQKIFNDAGYLIISEKTLNENELIIFNRNNQDYIINRANELTDKYPLKAKLFNKYIEAQEQRNELLENDIIGVTWLLQRK